MHPYALAAWAVLSAIPKVGPAHYVEIVVLTSVQVAVQQVERDQQIETLITVLQQTLDTIKDAEDLESRCHDPKQANIIARMLQQTGECGHFIHSYIKDTGFCESCVRLCLNRE